MIIGTAGHIDHGKTSLVRALTGVDTDRLPEEKQRGITIELGYAYLPAASGGVLGFIDVPGHEKFVHTMLAGATGIDFGLIVVAADDGVMPQTREHIDILHLLGIREGVVAITKSDHADPARLAAVAQEVSALLANTPLACVPLFNVSSITGAGVNELREHLFAALAAHHRIAEDAQFRLAIDRVFTLEGHGTVVTGTVFSGRISIGDQVTLTPPSSSRHVGTVRVRGIHTHNRRAEQGQAGDRCALNLAGIARENIARGQWLTGAEVAIETTRIDVSVQMLAGESAALRGGTQVHVHLGAAHTLGRVIPLDVDAIAPGAYGIAQLVLDHPVGAWRGERFILRDASARRTLAGGRVLDPFPPARYRRSRERLAALAAHAIDDSTQSLDALARATTWGVDLARFARSRCLSAAYVRGLPAACRIIGESPDEFAFDPERVTELKSMLLNALDIQHAQHPDLAGMDIARLKRMAMPKLPDAAMKALVDAILQEGAFVQNGVWLARPDHAERLNQQDRLIAERAMPLIADGHFNPPWVRAIARTIGQPETITRGVLARLAKQGLIFAIVKDLYYGAAAVAELSRIALRLDDTDHTVRAAAFRDFTGLGRKRAIQILEFFDQVGFTRRQGDDHKVRNRSLFSPTEAGTVPV